MRIGIDWGGTKIEVIALDENGATLLRERVKTPRDDYQACVNAVSALVAMVEAKQGRAGVLGLAYLEPFHLQQDLLKMPIPLG